MLLVVVGLDAAVTIDRVTQVIKSPGSADPKPATYSPTQNSDVLVRR